MAIPTIIRKYQRDPTTGRVLHDPETGQPLVIGDFINELKDAVQPLWLNTDSSPVTLPGLGTQRVSLTTPPEENLKGDLEIMHLMCVYDSPFAVRILHDGINKDLMNQPVHIANLAGDAMLPAILYETMMLETNTSLLLEFVNLVDHDNVIRFLAEGRRFINYEIPGLSKAMILESFLQRKTHPFWLTLDEPVTLDASGAAEGRMTVTGEADFDAAFGLDGGSDGPYSVEILQGRSGRSMMAEGEVHSQMIFGDARFPFFLKETALFKRQTSLRLKFTDLSGASNRIYPTFHGSLVYYSEYGRPDLHTLQPVWAPRRMGTRGTGGVPMAAGGPIFSR